MTEKKRTILHLIVGTVGTVASLLAANAFSQYVLMSLQLGARMVLMICAYWLIAIVPFAIMIFAKDRLNDYGFNKEKIGYQVIVGIMVGLCMSAVFTLVPSLLGKNEWVNNGHNYQEWWQFVCEFVYCIAAIGLVEEFVFRGFVFNKIKALSGSNKVAIAGSSVLFGLFHFLSGNIIQLIMTAFLGVIFCLCKEKIKNCTLLSVIIAHGVYDAMITVWGFVF